MSIREKYRIMSRGIHPHKERFSYGEYPKNWPKELKLAQAIRHYNIMQDSVELIENTLSEDTFRNRYEAAVREAQIVDDFIARAMNQWRSKFDEEVFVLAST